MEQTSPKRYLKQRKKRPKKLRMPIYGFAGLVFFGLLLFGLKMIGNVTSPKAPILVKGSPSLAVDQKEVDLGTIKLGKTVAYQFNLTNVGDKPLKLSKEAFTEVVKGCWPPNPTIGSMVLNPGKSTYLSLSFNMHGDDMGGPHEFRVHVPSNDPKQPDMTMTVLSNWVQ